MIRPMRVGDLDLVAGMEAELFHSASWSRALLEQELAAPDRFYFVWEGPDPSLSQDRQGQAVPVVLGYAGLWCPQADAATGFAVDAEVMTIGVTRTAQRSGIGKALLCALLDVAQSRGAQRLLLEVRVDNEPAKALYRQYGFQPMGLRRHYYQPEDIDALTMSLPLQVSGSQREQNGGSL